MQTKSPDTREPIGHTLSAGWLVDFLGKLSLPVIAWPGQSIFRALLHGYGIVLPIEESDSCIGFYTTYFVAARSVRAAEMKAVAQLQARWRTFCPQASGQLHVDVEDLKRINTRLHIRARYGMEFYSSDE